jgi:hypothetical protein
MTMVVMAVMHDDDNAGDGDDGAGDA